ncbi:ABC transporter ATP-binding protein [Paenibacillus thiaminolyticus]|uniref:ABC transporter ATP-binding protein n=1 Tax=Paenibacillus thiaminolyticus TaxID=49283 RepID=A0AAP9E041_PANTH|nr:ABC transporter ATP-binding protein [Paenibacillus thiaminolyticus]MCY9536204.1 ABC transporter ATP-binding protein [Paenibacillus thiaminolyticus]MCY9603531.1 ABC transporter ATP-binding protein [Paenibacillus thiaminolyticus]MCY9605665.1 ABC transporter ATP-binding protein [Paenibacillus thiaminolyticus]MCY9611834.1 ABC transporter ATP-binding protein [Paenibacillus thiaminolyticus]MCY9620967.1 ABC transporter ATP-binding protein [Paenibacillus thiaminolyticus]
MTLLQVQGIETHIGQFHILQGVTFEVKAGEITVVLGRNGAGKTTALRSIMGLNPVSRGEIRFQGERIEALPTHRIARQGIGYVPEDQGIFPELTVGETMRIAMRRNDAETKARLEWALELFPDLRAFWGRKSGLLSGGQKQMLAISRAYVNDNRLLLIDEPSKGLAPIMVEKLMQAIEQMKAKTTVLLVEQNFMMASRIGDRYVLMDEGRIVAAGTMAELRQDEATRRKYLGIA